jgi:hypothetical protein
MVGLARLAPTRHTTNPTPSCAHPGWPCLLSLCALVPSLHGLHCCVVSYTCWKRDRKGNGLSEIRSICSNTKAQKGCTRREQACGASNCRCSNLLDCDCRLEEELANTRSTAQDFQRPREEKLQGSADQTLGGVKVAAYVIHTCVRWSIDASGQLERGCYLKRVGTHQRDAASGAIDEARTQRNSSVRKTSEEKWGGGREGGEGEREREREQEKPLIGHIGCEENESRIYALLRNGLFCLGFAFDVTPKDWRRGLVSRRSGHKYKVLDSCKRLNSSEPPFKTRDMTNLQPLQPQPQQCWHRHTLFP